MDRPLPTTPREAVLDGIRAVAALGVGAIPFGLAFGVVAAASMVVPAVVGGLSSTIMFAGASQVAIVELLDSGAAWFVAVGTALVINARMLMYSGALAPAFGEFPPAWRFTLPYLITDQAAVTSLLRFETLEDPELRRWFFLGGGLTLWIPWHVATWVGVAVGTGIPASWRIDFAVPLMFIALLVPTIRRRADLVGSVVAATVAVAGIGLPLNLGILAGTAVGIGAGLAVGE
ncbi:MAG: AzlC family ABC transporter permease [Acidimicrobiia bacterium]